MNFYAVRIGVAGVDIAASAAPLSSKKVRIRLINASSANCTPSVEHCLPSERSLVSCGAGFSVCPKEADYQWGKDPLE